MKKIISLISLALVVLSCSKGDNAIDYVLDNFETGAVLRGTPISGQNTDFNYYGAEGTFALTIEEHDKENGGLFQDVEVYVSNGGSEALHTTMPASAFTTNSRGLPEADLVVTLAEAASTLGIPAANLVGGSSVVFRLQLNLTNGKSYTAKDAASSLTGSYFRSPYQYSKVIKCIPTELPAGNYTINMNDSYGDGWNGGFLTVTVDGEATDFTIADGPNATGTFRVDAATSNFSIAWTQGAWDSEVTYSIVYESLAGTNGQTALSEGPNPTAGTGGKTLSICPEN